MSQEDRAAIYAKLRAEGLTFQEIGERFGITRQCVEQTLKGRKPVKGSGKLPRAKKKIYKYSLSGWLTQADIGDEFFTTQPDRHVTVTAGRLGCKVKTERRIAIHAPTRQMRDLVRVELLERTQPQGEIESDESNS